jgi:queuine/archaeosine tRNA-ribosyltransferase
VCKQFPDAADVLARKSELAKHNLWTICHLLQVVRQAVKAGTLDSLLAKTLARHAAWFPDSQLPASWQALA